MKLLFTISVAIVLRASAGEVPKCAKRPPPDTVITNTGKFDGKYVIPEPFRGGWLEDNIWYDSNGCNPLKEEVWCNNYLVLGESDDDDCTGACVTYAANGSHCKEDNIPKDLDKPGLLTEGGFHPYPDCGSLDNDLQWGGFDENGVRFTKNDANVVRKEIISNSRDNGPENETFWKNNEKDKAKWLNNTNYVPGWFWCQAKKKCMHPQVAWGLYANGNFTNVDPRHSEACDVKHGGNWKDHIFEAPDREIFTHDPKRENSCQKPTGLPDNLFPANYGDGGGLDGHCQVYQLPVGNSYSGSSQTQCASGKVQRCEGVVGFFFSIKGFGHNYNFNFCLSTTTTDGGRTNAWDNGITPPPKTPILKR